MSSWQDLKTISQLVFAPVRGQSHQERLDSFYGAQAKGYDAFRSRLLRGRAELLNDSRINKTGTWVDLGGGTGANLEFAKNLSAFERVHIVDLSNALIDQARSRVALRKWENVEVTVEDAAKFSPPKPATLITFSYSLSMMPNWFEVIDQAISNLAPDGQIAVVDFYVSGKFARPGRVHHDWWTRNFWPLWFAADNVHLAQEILEYLHYRLQPVVFNEFRTKVPYLSLLGPVPYYTFIGRVKRD